MSTSFPSQRVPRAIDRIGIVGVLLVVVCVGAVVEPRYFFTWGNLSNVMRQTAVSLLLAAGQFFAILSAGIDLSVGSVMALSMVGAGICFYAGLPPAVAIVAPLLVGWLCGWLNGRGMVSLGMPHPFIVTLSMLFVARGVTNLLTGGVPISGMPRAICWLGGGEISLPAKFASVSLPVSFVLVILAYLALWIFSERTRLGRHVRAVGGDSRAASCAGVDVKKILIRVYAVSGTMAGLAGLVLAGRTNSAYPNAGIGAELSAIAAVVIGGGSLFGGRGSIGGTFVGALLIGLFRNTFNLMNVSAFWQQVFMGLVVLAAVALDRVRGKIGADR